MKQGQQVQSKRKGFKVESVEKRERYLSPKKHVGWVGEVGSVENVGKIVKCNK